MTDIKANRMRRLTPRQYNLQVAVTMTVYVVVMVLVWPLIRTAPGLLLKTLLAVVPVLPMLYVIALMARLVRDSDELEQRTHLLALGVATAVVGALSMLGGFLVAGGVLKLDGAILIWVFPVLMMVYSAARWWLVTRVYGGTMAMECDGSQGMLLRHRILLALGLMGFIALVAWWRGDLDDTLFGMLCGIGGALAAWLVVTMARRRRNGRA